MEPQDHLCQPIGAQQGHRPLQGGEDDDHDDPHRPKHPLRRRTKTGCLTCRKRRIKCDEAKPTCGNCIKSKRQCDYNQRVIFKEPMGTYGAFGMSGVGYSSDSSHAFVSHLSPTASKPSPSSYNPHQLIAPKPPSLDLHGGHHHPGHGYSGYGGEPASAISGAFDFNGPYANQTMPPTPPSAVSSASTQPPLDGLQWETHSSHGHGQPPHGPGYSSTQPARSLEAHERGSTGRHDYDIDFDGGSGDDLASESDGDEEANVVARRRDMGKVGAFGELLDGTIMVHPEIHETRMRTFSAYAEGAALTNYTPSMSHSALNDPQVLAIFRHFIFVTGPSMSLYERHPFDNSYISPDERLPQTFETVWTYTFPILSLGHPGLLQAILAIGALQIANLQRVPATAAMKHYHLAIRRISKSVRSPMKRAHPATLAATLLLGFFEVWSADHTKWCRHLYGARILFKDIPFREMTRTILPAKNARRRKVERQQEKQPFSPLFSYTDMDPDLDDVDVDLLSTISGRALSSEDYGSSFDADSLPAHQLPTDRDIEHYEHLRDLFWWNCKMDVYQSILGATKIFMPLEEWLPCPPRAPIGRLHAIYGTFDHLLLLLARLSDFGSRDIPRKKKVNRMPSAPGNSPPMFVGMLPTRGKVVAPVGFSPPRDTSPQSESLEDDDLEMATLAAHEEWEAIRHAFEVFRSRLGPDFQPLAEEFSDRRDTPFGTAIQYRTFSLAGIWMNYYMGLICLYRTHPSMPPAAMMAAGRAAKETAPFAREIGRIAAGLTDDVSDVTEISTLVGAALIECCFCLFVAGIQFQDSAQRHWLIRRLHDVSRLTGWGSARQIAVGCEASWVRAAHMGRGPPYVRSTDPITGMQSSDPMAARPATVWSNPRRIDRRMREMGDGAGDGRLLVLQKADRAHFALGLLSVETDMDKLKLEDD